MAQSMQQFISNMLRMREQNAEAERFKAAMQQKQQEEWGDFISQMGTGITNAITKNAPTARDRLANQMMQAEYTIPGAQRAQAVNPALQGPADAIAGNMYKGGMAEFEMRQKMEDQTAQRLVQGSQIDSRTARNEASLANIELAGGNLAARQREIDLKEEGLVLRKELAEQARQRKIAEDAAAATKAAGEDYMKQYNRADAYNKRVRSHMEQITTAKDPNQYQAGVDAMNAEYEAGQKFGLKAEKPLIRPFLSSAQKQAIQDQQALVDQYSNDWDIMNLRSNPAPEQKKLEQMPGYNETRPGYTPPPQPEGIYAAPPPPPNFTAPSLNAPAQAAGGSADTAGPQPISADEAFKMTGKQLPPGKRFDSGPGTQVYVVK